LRAAADDQQIVSRRGALSSFLAAGVAVATSGLVTPVDDAQAVDGSRVIGKISGSGLVFKDTLVVEAFDDPKVKGVTLYVSNFERPMTGTIFSS
jgi:catabolite regulation protein CreA